MKGRIARYLPKQSGSILLHLSLLLILIGGILTSLTAERGTVVLRKDVPVFCYLSNEGEKIRFNSSVTLLSAETIYYPGSGIPSGYSCLIDVDGDRTETLDLNSSVRIGECRLTLSSFGCDGRVTMSVDSDPYGRAIVYTGFLFFFVGACMILSVPGTRFRKQLRGLAIISLLVSPALHMEGARTIPRYEAEKLGAKEVIYQGKHMSFNTFSKDYLKKLYGRGSFHGLSPEQVVAGMMLFPEEWGGIPMIKSKDKDLVRRFSGREGVFLSVSDLFESDGEYKIDRLRTSINYEDSGALNDLDEKVGMIIMLYDGSLFQPVPNEREELSDSRISLEIFYNSIPWTLIAMIILSTGSLLSILMMLRGLSAVKWGRSAGRLFISLITVAEVIIMPDFTLKWILLGYPPLDSLGGTLQFALIGFIALEWVLLRKVNDSVRPVLRAGLSLTAMVAGVMVFLLAPNPLVTPLMPVLHSPWLTIHVSVIMLGYSFLILASVTSVVALCAPSRRENLLRTAYVILVPGVLMTGVGIMTGSLWADLSWGRYWDWDPKETWALITFIFYAIPLHPRLPGMKRPLCFHLTVATGLLFVLMTYVGVNYLPSLHAYS